MDRFLEKLSPQRCKEVYKVHFVVVSFILGYWLLLLYVKKRGQKEESLDPLNRIVIDVPYMENCCSWWPISHFIFFFILGLLFPCGCDILILLSGILWEIFEVAMFMTMSKGRQGVRKKDSGKVEYSTNWWAGSFKDIFFNITGFYTGKALAMFAGKKTNLGESEDEKEKQKEREKEKENRKFSC